MSFVDNLEAAREYRDRIRKSAMGRILHLDCPDFVESYCRETDTLVMVSHYYRHCPALQGVFTFCGGVRDRHSTRSYASTRGLTTLDAALRDPGHAEANCLTAGKEDAL